MNTMFTILGIVVLFLVFAGWMAYGYYKDNKNNIDSIRTCRQHKQNGDVLLLDYWRLDDIFGINHKPTMDCTKTWGTPGTDPENPYENFYRSGYLFAEKWMPNLRYAGIPVFVKLHNFYIIDPKTINEKEIGFQRNRLTSSIMYNVYKARTLKKFIDGITKIRLGEMDMKSLGIIIPIVIGLVIGVAYFMMGGF